MKARYKMIAFVLLLALAVQMGGAVPAKAEEQEEWSNFGEYCIVNGIDLDSLPCEYDSSKRYVYYQQGKNRYLMVFDENAKYGPTVSGQYSGSCCYVYWNYAEACYNSTDGGTTWTNVVNAYKYTSMYLNDFYFTYTDYKIDGSYYGYVVNITKTGNIVAWEDALAQMPDSIKTELQGYENYIVQRNPYRVNDWKSEQIMIACSNASKAVVRENAYGAVCFTTGSGKEAGVTYAFDSHTMTWQKYDKSYAYTVGSKLETGGELPEVLWSSVDIYKEEGVTYGLADEVWKEAAPYGGSDAGADTEEAVTDGFPRLFEVTDSYAAMYESADKSSSMLILFAMGKSGIIYGVEYDADGAAWYHAKISHNGTTYEGYMLASAVEAGFTVPTTGSTDTTPTPTPTPAITEGKSAVVIGEVPPVYTVADTSSEVIDYLSTGEQVYVFGRSFGSGGSFYRIKYFKDDSVIEGYVLTEHISFGSDSSSSEDTAIGGEAKPGSGLDFIVTVYTMIWTRICSIPMNVDGYSISIQQIAVYGILAGIIGGSIYAFFRGKK